MAEPETKINQFRGLYSSVDPFSKAPHGAFRIADNVVFEDPGLVAPRRGFTSYLTPGSSPLALYTGLVPGPASQQLSFGMAWLRDRSFYSYIADYSNPASPVVNGQVVPFNPGTLEFTGQIVPHYAAGRVRLAQVNKNTYCISALGLLKSEDNLNFRHTQMPMPSAENLNAQGYGTRCTALAKGVVTYNWLADQSQCNYKIRVARKGPNGDYVYGAPSGPCLAYNTSGAATAVLVNLNIGPLSPTDGFVEIFRTKQVKTTEPLPENYYKVAELAVPNIFPNADGYSQATRDNATAAGYQYSDIVSDAGLGGPLETNPLDGNGVQSQFAPCPAAADLAYFRNRMYVANTIDVQRLVLPLTGTGSYGIQAGDTLTIDGLTYVWQNATGFDYLKPVLLTGAGSVFLNLLASAHSLEGAINYGQTDAWNKTYAPGYTPLAASVVAPRTVYNCLRATYIGDSAQPGAVLLERLIPGSPAFSVNFNTVSTNGYGIVNGKTSDPNAQVAGLRYSLEGAPESFPIANNLIVGDPGQPITRILGTKNSLWIFKQDGLYRLVDNGYGPQVSIFDPTVRLDAPDSAVVLGNSVYCLANQGVLRISEQGVENISTAFQRELLDLVYQTSTGPNVYNLAYGIAYESEGRYILSLPVALNSTNNTVHYVYDNDSSTWSTFSFRSPLLCGSVDRYQDKLILGADGPALWLERKSYSQNDHADVPVTVACPAGAVGTTTTTLTFTTPPGLLRGDYVSQTSGGHTFGAFVRSVSNDLKIVTLASAPTYSWVSGNLSVLPCVPATLQFLPIVGDNELLAKTYNEHIRMVFKYCDLPFYDAQVGTDEVPVPENISNGRVPLDFAWGTGSGAWGSTTWGPDATLMVSRATLSDLHARGAELDLTLYFGAALRRFELASIAIGTRAGSESDRIVP